MKSKVRLSKYSLVLSVIVNLIYAGICYLIYQEPVGFCIFLSLWIIFLIGGLLFGPIRIEANPRFITIRTALLKHRISVPEIKSIELFKPTMAARRLFGSGGYFGYWGLFRESDIGRYTAYYGKASDCFLIRLKDGKQYVLGCQNPVAMVNYIKNLIV